MSDLRNVISRLASQFANGVLEAIRAASLEDILLETRSGDAIPARTRVAASSPSAAARPAKKSARLERRSEGAIADVVATIVTLLGQHPKGLRAEEIRSTLGLDAKELPRPIAQALAERKITKVGEKRATTYFAAATRPAPSPKSPAPPSAKEPKAKKALVAPKPAAAPPVKAASSKAAARQSPATKGEALPTSDPKAKTPAKGGAAAPKAADKGKKPAKTAGKALAKGTPAHKPSSIEEAVTIVTTGGPEDISG